MAAVQNEPGSNRKAGTASIRHFKPLSVAFLRHNLSIHTTDWQLKPIAAMLPFPLIVRPKGKYFLMVVGTRPGMHLLLMQRTGTIARRGLGLQVGLIA